MNIGHGLRVMCLTAPLALGACSGVLSEVGFAPGVGGAVAETPYEAGKRQFAQGQYGLALKSFQEAVSKDPTSVEALNGVAAAYDKLGRFDLSARYYGRALALVPDSTQTLNNIGYSYLMQERYDLAVAYLRDAYTRDAKDPVVVANRGTAEVALQDQDLRAAKAQGPLADLPATEVAETRQQAVKPWIERTAARVQTLVTEPQYALVEAAAAAGVPPELASYDAVEVSGEHILPQPITAPLTESAVAQVARSQDAVAIAAVQIPPIDEAPVQVAELVVYPVSEAAQVAAAPTETVVEETLAVVPAATAAVDSDEIRDETLDESLDETLQLAALSAPIEPPASPVAGALELPFVELSNGTGRLNMAARLRDYLEGAGVSVRRLTNADHYSHMESVVYYRTGWQIFAEQVAAQLPAAVDLVQNDAQRSDIRVLLGGDLLEFDAGLYYADLRGANDRAS